MQQIYKKMTILLIIFVSTLLYADGTDVSITVTDASPVYEKDGAMQFTIQLSEAPWFSTVTVDYETADGTARAGKDYNSVSGSVTFYPTQSTKVVEVPIIDDSTHENSEYLYLNISNSETGYVVTDSSGKGIIYDDDAPPLEAKIYNRYENEGDNSWVLKFTVGLNQNAPNDITVNYTTIDSSAKAGEDYVASSGTLTIPKGSKYGYIPITILGDVIPESTEKFKIKIDSISQGTIKRAVATGTLKNDDTIKVYIKSSNVKEGDINDHNKMPFTIYLKKEYPLDTPLTINYQTIDGSNPTATAGVDYIAKSGTVTFNKGDIKKVVYISIIGDNDIEPHEYLKMKIWGSSYIKRTTAQSKIVNDDGSYPKLYFKSSNFYITEGNSSTKNLNFEFKLNKPAIKGSSFEYYTTDGTATVSDNDYLQISTTKYTFNGGEQSVTIPVTINGDIKIESDEYFYLQLKNADRVRFGSTNSKGHILNDDGSYPILKFDSNRYTISEGDSGEKSLNFTMTLDRPALKGSSFRYYTEDDTATVSDNDYLKISTTKYTFNGGERNITIPVIIKGDTKIEDSENFYLKIDSEQNLTISDTKSPIGTILNDDGSYPQIDIEKSEYYINEGNSSTTKLEIKVVLDRPALKDTTIKYYTQDREAQDGNGSAEDSDYLESRGIINIDENSTTASIEITINGDSNIEPDEDFKLYITDAKNLTIGRDSTTITIVNDDVATEEPFICDNQMYLSSSIKRGSNITGKMWLHRIDTSKSPFAFNVMDDAGEEKLYNALAYNEIDNYIYGLYYKELFKISKTGKVMSLGEVTKLPDLLANKQAYAGASYNGYYFVTGFGANYDKIYKIKLSDSDENRTVEDINLSTAISIKDFSFSPDGKYLYGIVDGGKLTKIDVNSGHVTFIGDAHTGYEFDSSFSYKDNRFFANDSNGNGFFEFNLKTGEKYFISDSQSAEFNDGANCIEVNSPAFYDYGDAPESYGKAQHGILKDNPYLGNNNADKDNKPYFTLYADGDDLNGKDDDDGVTLIDDTDINNTYFETNKTHELKIKVSKEGYLSGWIDYDIDGKFDNKDKIISGQYFTVGEHIINFTVPDNVTENRTTYMRFRFSSTAILNSTDDAVDGEVEDYSIRFGSGVQPLQGVFNIERTNSGAYSINSKERNAWFTQIVGRDFDYSILFYNQDMSAEQEIDGVAIKVELINEDNNATLYEKYAYIKNTPPKSRIDNLLPNDLNTLPATKRARFRVYYGVDNDGNILQTPCESDPKICFNLLPKKSFNDARDNFAIRPAYFHLIISDNNKTLRVNTAPNNTSPLRVSAGYDYNLTVTASSFNGTDINPSIDYNNSVIRVLEFLDKNSSNCRVRDDFNKTEIFKNGKNITNLLELQEVGKYRLKLKDSSWAEVDIESGDCDINKSYTSANGNILSGCNIVSTPDINLSFYPYKFDINLSLYNLPNSSHNDFIYMSEINSTFNSVAISYQGDIVAKSQDDTTTTNFTSSCMAEDVLLDLVVTTMSDGGIDKPITTTKGTAVEFTRVIKFNNEVGVIVDRNQTFANLPTINITKDKFKDDNNGTVFIDIRYNVNKSLSETINPIQITFHKADVNSTNSYSLAEKIDNFIPKGLQNLGNSIRNFYFAQVAPDKNRYPRVYFKNGDTIRTPMQIEIFCGSGVDTQYCTDTNLTNHIKEESSPRAEIGWFLSIDHNATVDGAVTALIPKSSIPNVLQFKTASLPTFPILFTNGRNGTVTTKFTNPHGTQKYRVDIYPDPPLKYYGGKSKSTIPKGFPDFQVEGTENNASTWTGVGETGNLLEMKANTNSAHKMDW